VPPVAQRSSIEDAGKNPNKTPEKKIIINKIARDSPNG
jgi:hypothetical protein